MLKAKVFILYFGPEHRRLLSNEVFNWRNVIGKIFVKFTGRKRSCEKVMFSLQDIVIETMLGWKNNLQGPVC